MLIGSPAVISNEKPFFCIFHSLASPSSSGLCCKQKKKERREAVNAAQITAFLQGNHVYSICGKQ